MKSWSRRLPMSSPRTATFRSSSSRPKRGGLRPRFACVEQPPMMPVNRPQGSRFPQHHRQPIHQQSRWDRKHDPTPTRVAEPLRCYAPEEFGHSIPHRVVCRATLVHRREHEVAPWFENHRFTEVNVQFTTVNAVFDREEQDEINTRSCRKTRSSSES